MAVTPTKFLIPSPTHYLHSLSYFMLSQLIEYDREYSGYGIETKIGDIIESHIGEALICIFGEKNVHKISKPEAENEPFADFYIEHAKCDLIIEIKKSLGSLDAHSLIMPKDVAEVWSKLYKATKQCAASVKRHQRSDKRIIPIIISFNNFEDVFELFQQYAKKSKIFTDMGIKWIEIFSWANFEHALSKTSIDCFIESLLEKWVTAQDQEIKPKNVLFGLKNDSPSHRYQYLEEWKNIVHGN